MAAPKIITQAEWDVRALELAEGRHLMGTPRYLSEDEYGHVWRVPSRSGHGSYDVLARHNGGCIECPCVAGLYGKPCGHAGAVLHAEAQRKAAEAEASAYDDPAWAWWMAGGEWLG